MKFIPILFRTQMVQAILEGRKTMTRQLDGLEGINKAPNRWTNYRRYGGMAIGPHTGWKHQFYDDTGRGFFDIRSPYEKGDVLWVRESFCEPWLYDGCEHDYYYKATDHGKGHRHIWGTTWTPGIEMPIIACRIFLEINDVRVERLHDISPNDAGNEGVNYINADFTTEEGAMHADYENYMWKDDENYEDYYFPFYAEPISSFRSWWFKINGAESWNANPFVWVITFKKIEKPTPFLTGTTP